MHVNRAGLPDAVRTILCLQQLSWHLCTPHARCVCAVSARSHMHTSTFSQAQWGQDIWSYTYTVCILQGGVCSRIMDTIFGTAPTQVISAKTTVLAAVSVSPCHPCHVRDTTHPHTARTPWRWIHDGLAYLPRSLDG